MPNNIPNFDSMSRDDLMAFWKKYHRPTRKDAEYLIGDKRNRYTSICSELANYASNKAAAIICRMRKDTKGALIYEHIADTIYDRLPIDLRW